MLLNLRDRERDPRVCKQRIERLSRTNRISCNRRKLVIVCLCLMRMHAEGRIPVPGGAGWLTSWNSTTVPKISPEALRSGCVTEDKTSSLRLNTQPAGAPVYASTNASPLIAKLEVRTVCYSFPVRLFHSRQHAGLSRRTDRLRFGF